MNYQITTFSLNNISNKTRCIKNRKLFSIIHVIPQLTLNILSTSLRTSSKHVIWKQPKQLPNYYKFNEQSKITYTLQIFKQPFKRVYTAQILYLTYTSILLNKQVPYLTTNFIVFNSTKFTTLTYFLFYYNKTLVKQYTLCFLYWTFLLTNSWILNINHFNFSYWYLLKHQGNQHSKSIQILINWL